MNIYPEVEFRDQVCMDAESVNRRWRRGGTRARKPEKATGGSDMGNRCWAGGLFLVSEGVCLPGWF